MADRVRLTVVPPPAAKPLASADPAASDSDRRDARYRRAIDDAMNLGAALRGCGVQAVPMAYGIPDPDIRVRLTKQAAQSLAAHPAAVALQLNVPLSGGQLVLSVQTARALTERLTGPAPDAVIHTARNGS